MILLQHTITMEKQSFILTAPGGARARGSCPGYPPLGGPVYSTLLRHTQLFMWRTNKSLHHIDGACKRAGGTCGPISSKSAKIAKDYLKNMLLSERSQRPKKILHRLRHRTQKTFYHPFAMAETASWVHINPNLSRYSTFSCNKLHIIALAVEGI